MAEKEGKVFIEIVCPNCGCVVKNGWSYKPEKNEETNWTGACPFCKMPISIKFVVN